MLLEISTMLSIVIPTILVIYLYRISNKREEFNKLINYIGSFAVYALLIIMVDKNLIQLLITIVYSSTLYFLFQKELDKIKQEQQKAILDRMEASYQKYAVRSKRRKI